MQLPGWLLLLTFLQHSISGLVLSLSSFGWLLCKKQCDCWTLCHALAIGESMLVTVVYLIWIFIRLSNWRVSQYVNVDG